MRTRKVIIRNTTRINYDVRMRTVYRDPFGSQSEMNETRDKDTTGNKYVDPDKLN